MKNWKFPPKDLHVAKYVECYWLLEKEQYDVGNDYPKLNPDPSAHLILSSTHQQYRYDQGFIYQKGKGNHWIFPHRKTFVMDHSSPFLVIGIKFRVGALYSLNNSYSHTKLNKIEMVDIKKLTGADSFNVDAQLSKVVQSPQVVCDRLDHLLRPWLCNSNDDKYSELVRHVIPLLNNTPIAQIGSVLHCSQRTVERNFLKVTGFTLKQCQSMIRLEAILDYLYRLESGDINWVDVATKFGFSDQPHLIRYLKNTIGTTPGEYTRQRDFAIDIYGRFEFN